MFETKTQQIKFVENIALRLFEGIATPRAVSCFMLLKYKEYDQLAELKCIPEDYADPSVFRDDYQCTALLSKWPVLPTKHDRKGNALKTFLQAESRCYMVNHVHLPRMLTGFNASWSDHFERTRKKIAYVLGKCPDLLTLANRFGPGTSSSCTGKQSTLVHKLSNLQNEATPKLRAYLELRKDDLFHTNLSLYRSLVGEVVDGLVSTRIEIKSIDHNRLAFVPKTCKTDRSICIEPDLNIYFQLGVGDYIRKRMAQKLNIDLDNLADRNRCLARIGSISGTYATIDLKSASDTVSYSLVEWLLPEDWFDMLCMLRCPKTKYPDGSVHYNEKFSSMGNGFTFELESLIFTCVLRACITDWEADHIAHSFGDDCIIESEYADKAIYYLKSYGFEVNTDKTFLAGPFRESCGTDWFQGIDVRPYFLKKELHDVPDLFSVANGIRKASSFSGISGLYDRRYMHAWLAILHGIKPALRYFGPAYCGDTVIWGSRSECKTRHNSGSKEIIKCYQFKPTKVKLTDFPAFAQIGTILYSGQPVLRAAGCYKVRSIEVPFWDSLSSTWI